MAEIAPFRGIVYNPDRTGDLGSLVAPPYDVVSPDEQAAYHRLNPYNVLHIDLGAARPEDKNHFEWHHRAALEFHRWRADGVLVRHDRPAVYYTEMDFADPRTGARKTRHGFVCLLRLEEYGEDAKVRPHERTFSAHKAERLHLTEHVQAHLSQVFTAFPDEKQQAVNILQAGLRGKPIFDFADVQNFRHRLWAIRDRAVIHALGRFMLDKTIYIADGHHRYETALNYRRLKAERGVKIGPKSPLNYIMVYCCPISDPGLAILPAHRLLCRIGLTDPEELEMALCKFFDIQKFNFDPAGERHTRRAFTRALDMEGRRGSALGLYTKLARTYYLLKPRSQRPGRTALDVWPETLRKLDTVVMTSLIFQEILGMSDEDLDDADRIAYTSKVDEAIRRVDEGRADLAGILNPTPMEQVQAVAEEGLIMPRKSTYFYPKVQTGLVFNTIDPFEEIEPAF